MATYSAGYIFVACWLALADIGLTTYVLEHDPDTFELNVMTDASTFSALLGGAAKSLALFSILFIASFAACIAGRRMRRTLHVFSRWDEVFVRVPGAAAIWYPIILIGAVVNNAGLILFDYSWLQAILELFGSRSNAELMAGFLLFSVISFVVLLAPSYLVFSRIVRRAQQSLEKAESVALGA